MTLDEADAAVEIGSEKQFYEGKLRSAEGEHRKLKKAFRDYTDRVKAIMVLLDDAMKQPESIDRGRRIAYLINQLEVQTDCERRFRLDLDFNGRPLRRNKKTKAA